MMNHRKTAVSKENYTKPRRTRPLQIEQLEARLMNAINAIEMGIEAFTLPHLHEQSQNEVPAAYGVHPTDLNSFRNAAPVIVRPVSFLTGTVVSGNSVRASVLAADNGGEQSLVYRWSVVRSPAGSVPSFSVNNSNAAKNTTLRFDRAGEYEIMATAVDATGLTASSTSRLTVTPVMTSLRVVSIDGQVVDPTSGFTTAQGTPAFRIQGVDQFGQGMSQSLPAVWTLRSGPRNATVSQVAQGDFTRFQFSHQDSYSLQATVGNRIVQFSVQNVRSTGRLELLDSAGRIIPAGGLVNVSSTRALTTVRVYNAQGALMATPTSTTWAIVTGPAGGAIQTSWAGSQATVTFNRAGIYDLNVSAGGLSQRIQFRVNPVLTSLVVSPNIVSVQAGRTAQFTTAGRDQFGIAMATNPTVTWSATGGTISSTGLFTAAQTIGPGTVTAASGTIRGTARVSITAPPTASTSLQLRDAAGNVLSDVAAVPVSGTQLRVQSRIVNSSGQVVNSAPTVTMTVNSAPAGGAATFTMSGSTGTIQFTRVGNYDFTMTSGTMTRRLRVAVSATLTSLQLTPNTASIQASQTRQFTVAGRDQFGQAMASIPAVTWSATGGTVSVSGLFTAGSVAGSGSVRAQAGTISATATIAIAAAPSGPFQNAALAQLVQTYYADNMLSRTEVMAILRSTGNDSVVDSTELNDLRALVNSTQYVMPAHVRGLARNIVTVNPANLKVQGQAAGNLVAGSSSTLLNRLVDKWFLGVDTPTVTVNNLTYTNATGTLFNVGPSLNDIKQGYVGDCYLLAALGSIASRNQQAIRDIFDDNGDGTFTVRFFGRNSAGVATADYVTVNRRLPTYSSIYLYYAGLGAKTSDPNAVLWVALAEKAYAQWNETGRAGRDGTNSYAGIEGGWMSEVNFQILGYNSTNYSFSTTTQQTLINAIHSGLAVTAGTKTSVPSNLVASHAYSITGYNSSTGRFTLYNPWGNTHPSPLSWAELQSHFSMFTTTSPGGSGGEVQSGPFASSSSVAIASPIQVVPLTIENVGAMSQESTGLWTEEVVLTPSTRMEFSGETSMSCMDACANNVFEKGDEHEKEVEEKGYLALKDLALLDLYLDSLRS